MKYQFHTIILGAGSGGLVVASAAASLGAKVALVESDKMGGDCLNAGCVPSKTFLRSAHLAADIKRANEYALDVDMKGVDIEKVMERVRSVINEIEPHDSKARYESLGVKVFLEKGVLIDKHSVKLNDSVITAKYIVIATGSKPFVPDIPGLSDIDYLTNKNIFSLKKLPKHLIVLGGGPIGLELGQGFCHLGSKVTVIDRGKNLFKKDELEVAPIIEEQLIKDGVELKLLSSIQSVSKCGDKVEVKIIRNNKEEIIIGDKILVSLGRTPVSSSFGLEEIGVSIDKRGYIQTSKKLQTSVKNIYACGDVVGPYQFTHMAGYQAGIIIRNIIFKLGSKVDYSLVPWTTYTKPEVAHVGYTQPWAESLGIYSDSVMVNLEEMDRAKTENDRVGFLKLNLNKRKQIIGATLVSEKGGEMIPIATMAIRSKLKVNVFLDMVFSYPTEAEIFKFAALKQAKKSFKNWHKFLIKKIM
jgi:pyruvate/2-oxoglutarate dehydrogenase complex dihydrolipoamide dehydrogenase (E3) component